MVITRAISRLMNNVSFDHSTPNTSATVITMPQNQSEPMSANRTSYVKLPSFWTSCPEAWFIQAEMQFLLHNIDDDAKRFQNIVISLPENVITSVLDVIQSTDVNQRYAQLKNALCKRFTLSDESRMNKLFSELSLGDKTPSELFRSMTLIAGNNSAISQQLILKLWMRQLPQNIQSHLTSSSLSSIEEKLTLADKLHEISYTKEIFTINSSQQQTQNQQTTLEQSLHQLAELTTNLCTNLNSLNIEVNEIKKKQNNFKQKNGLTQQNICWYHLKYGINAKFCKQPCAFKKNHDSNFNKNLN